LAACADFQNGKVLTRRVPLITIQDGGMLKS